MIKRRKTLLCAIASLGLMNSSVVVPLSSMASEKTIDLKSTTTTVEVINTSSLNIRKGPSTKYAKIGTAKRGQKFSVISVSNGWAKINFNGQTAYASMNYLKYVSVSNPETKKEMVVKVNDLNVRTGASTKYSILGKLNKGDKVIITQTLANNWLKIEYKNGFGYVSNVKGAYLEEVKNSDSTKPEIPVKPEYQKREMIAKVNSLNVRTGASTKHSILGKLNKGDKVISLEELSNGWVKVEYKGKTGYVSNVKGAYLEPSVYVADREESNKVISLINLLNKNIGLTDKDAVIKARESYNSLNSTAKSLVTNLSVLTSAEAKIAKLEAELEDAKLNQEKANVVINMIDSLSLQISLVDKEAVIEARKAYDLLNEKAKVLVTNLDVLTSAEAKITELEDAKVNQEKATEVISLIDLLNTQISLTDKEAIIKAREAYELLNDTAKLLVTNVDKLTDAENEIIRLEKEQVDKEASQIVISMIGEINGILDITLTDKELVFNTRTAYDNLNSEAKAMVSSENLAILEKAEETIARLEKLERDTESARVVSEKIDTLNRDIVYSDLETIRGIRVEYEALNAEAKALVLNTYILIQAESKVQLSVNKVGKVVRLINAIPEKINLEHKVQIEEARRAYEELLQHEKDGIASSTTSILIGAESEIKRLEIIRDNIDVQAVISEIESLPALDTITIDNKDEIFAVMARYRALPEDVVFAVDATPLIEAFDKIEGFLASDIVSEINTLPSIESIELSHKSTIFDLRNRYDELNIRNKGKVTNLNKLKEAEAKILELEALINANVNEVSSKIELLPSVIDISWGDENLIKEARNAFNALTYEEQLLILNISKLEDAEAEWERIDTGISSVLTLINNIPALEELTLEHKQLVVDARNAYDLSDDKITYYVDSFGYHTLVNAEKKIDNLEKLEANPEAKALALKIDVLLNKVLTADDKVEVSRLRGEYELLSLEAKKLINFGLIEELEMRIAGL